MRRIFVGALWIILIFAVLDGLRDTFFPDSAISFLKEGVVLLIFSLMIVGWKGGRLDGMFSVYFNVGAIFFLLLTAITTGFYGVGSIDRARDLAFGGWSLWVKLFTFVLLANFLSFMRRRFPCEYKKIPKYYISLVIFYCALTLFFVSTGLVDNLPARNWSGRLAIGYPTMDSLILVVGCVFAAFYVESKFFSIILHILFLTVLFMQNTITGYLLFLTYLASMCFWLPGKWRVFPLLSLLVFLTLGWMVYVYIAQDLGDFGLLLVDKINGIFFGGESSSFSIREEQIATLEGILGNDYFSELFGHGGGVAFLVESQYYSMRGMGGEVGVLVYFALLAALFFRALRMPRCTDVILLLLLYVVGSISLIASYLYPFLFLLAYAFSRLSAEELGGRLALGRQAVRRV